MEKKGTGKPYERTQTGTRKRRDPAPKHNFRVELKELIAIPNIAARLKVPAKTDRKMGPNKNAWCEFHQANGHYIFNCMALAHQLDELVKSGFCSGRLTWDVFVRNLTRQLGTPSHWLPVDSCKEGQKGALAAVCTPTLKSAGKKHQNSAPPYRNTVDGALKVIKRTVYCVYFCLWQTTFL